MADTKISGLTAATSVDGTEVVPIVQTTTKKSTLAIIRDWMQGAFTSLTANQVTVTGGTVTTSTPVLGATQTWNDAGVTFTGIKMDVTSTASAAGSLLADLQVGSASKFSVGKDGRTVIGARTTAGVGWKLGGANEAGNVLGVVARLGDDSNYCAIHGARLTASAGFIGCWSGTDWTGWAISGDYFCARTTGRIGWTDSDASSLGGTEDLTLCRKAAASLQFGKADAASAVAQTVGPQSVVAGTSNTAGANFTIRGSQGTGTGAGGSLIFQVAPAGTTGTAQNALVTRFSISGSGLVSITNLTGTPELAFSTNAGYNSRIALAYSSAYGIPNYETYILNQGNFSIRQGSGYCRFFFNNTLGSLIFNGAASTINPVTANLPALKPASTALEVKLADDSGYTNIKGKLTTETNYTAGAPTATGYIVLYDASGAAYKVPAVAV